MAAYEEAVGRFMQENEDLQIPEDQNVCRICHSPETPDSDMVSPCRCTGTMGRVHHACLSRWVLTSQSYKCQTCRYKFRCRTEMKQVPKRVLISLLLTQLRKTLEDIKKSMTFPLSLLVFILLGGLLLLTALVCGIVTAALCALEGFGPAFTTHEGLDEASVSYSPLMLSVPLCLFLAASSPTIIMITQAYKKRAKFIVTFWISLILSIAAEVILVNYNSPDFLILSSGNATYLVQDSTVLYVQSADNVANASIDFTKVPRRPDSKGRLYFLPWTNYLGLLFLLFPVVVTVFCILDSVRYMVYARLSSITFEDCAEDRNANNAGTQDQEDQRPSQEPQAGDSAAPPAPHVVLQLEQPDHGHVDLESSHPGVA